MKKSKLNILFFIQFLLLISSVNLLAEDEQILYDTIPREFFSFPKKYNSLETGYQIGIDITRLPVQVVEEEIAYSPMPTFDFRLGLPADLSLMLRLNSNYISNNASLGLQWSDTLGIAYYSLGASTSVWFGHLQLESIKLKSWGIMLNPQFTLGFDFGSMFFSTQFETQHHIFWTYAETEFLGKLKRLDGGFAVKFTAEQLLWNDNWISLSLKLNYAKFYYQSWLSYTTVDEYLFYPEFMFGFIL